MLGFPIPSGYTKWSKRGDLLVVQSGVLDMFAGTSIGGAFVCPFDARIVELQFVVLEALGTAASTFALGTLGDPDKFLNDYSVETSVTAGTAVDLSADALLVDALIDKFELVAWSSTDGATTTGKVLAYAVLEPRYIRDTI